MDQCDRPIIQAPVALCSCDGVHVFAHMHGTVGRGHSVISLHHKAPLKRNLATSDVDVQSVLMVNVLDCSNKPLRSCYIDLEI